MKSPTETVRHRGWKGWLKTILPQAWKAAIRRRLDVWSEPSLAQKILAESSQTNTLLAAWIYEQARQSPRFAEPKRLLAHGFKAYSQHDEDGIIEEIFRRIGYTDRFFVEFGVGDGLENCTLYLLLRGWSGAWIDGSAACYEAVCKNLDFLISANRLRVLYSFITAGNIETLFERLQVPAEFDLLSIDIDNNDYWVWRAIEKYRPRVVAIEYNASYQASANCVVEYAPERIWDLSNSFGASLKALELLGREKGYSLVGCNYSGVTAFFVRNDLLQSHFAEPFTSENHFEPPRYFMRMPNGHPTRFGKVLPHQSLQSRGNDSGA